VRRHGRHAARLLAPAWGSIGLDRVSREKFHAQGLGFSGWSRRQLALVSWVLFEGALFVGSVTRWPLPTGEKSRGMANNRPHPQLNRSRPWKSSQRPTIIPIPGPPTQPLSEFLQSQALPASLFSTASPTPSPTPPPKGGGISCVATQP